MPILTRDDLGFFEDNGYVVVREAVPREMCEAVVDAIFEFLGMHPSDPQDWYRPPLPIGGMVEMYHHQSMWDNRQYPRMHEAFTDIYGTRRLWVSFDRVNLKPPRHPDHPDYDHKGFIHWDTDTSKLPLPFRVQGVLCLRDTAENQGGFQCVPGMHRRLEEWVSTQPQDRNPRAPDLTGLEVKQVPGKAGDLIIWHIGLAHGNGHNISNQPRFSQYVTMYPAREDDERAVHTRRMVWQNRLAPPGFPGHLQRIEEIWGETAELTPLGRRLVGLERWEEE